MWDRAAWHSGHSTQLLLCAEVALTLLLIMLQYGICKRCLWMVKRFENTLNKAIGKADNGGLDARLDFTCQSSEKKSKKRDEC
jgi:hypothetical protein